MIIIIILSRSGPGGPLRSQTSVLAVFPVISSSVVWTMLFISTVIKPKAYRKPRFNTATQRHDLGNSALITATFHVRSLFV
jgi:hypothetical protein